MKVYTFGYGGQSFQRFVERVANDDLVVLDIRYSPRSRIPVWSKHSLSNHLGNIEEKPGRYRALPQWGNVNYINNKPISILDFEAGLEIFRSVSSPTRGYSGVVLLCVCALPESCHRTGIANRLKELGYEVEELHL